MTNARSSAIRWLTGFKMCAPTATRTRDLLLRRHSRSVAGRSPEWPDVPFDYSGNGWMWPGVAPCLWLLAPSWAPRISLATLMFELRESGTGVFARMESMAPIGAAVVALGQQLGICTARWAAGRQLDREAVD